MKMLFNISLAVNILLLCIAAYLWHYTSHSPEYTPPLVSYVFTNSPLTAEAREAQLHGLHRLAGFDTNSVNPIP